MIRETLYMYFVSADVTFCKRMNAPDTADFLMRNLELHIPLNIKAGPSPTPGVRNLSIHSVNSDNIEETEVNSCHEK